MTKIEEIKRILEEKKASLVVYYENGEIKEYYQDRIKDIKDILNKDKSALKNAIVADKVIRKSCSVYSYSIRSKRNICKGYEQDSNSSFRRE